jgi:hypothetical protein
VSGYARPALDAETQVARAVARELHEAVADARGLLAESRAEAQSLRVFIESCRKRGTDELNTAIRRYSDELTDVAEQLAERVGGLMASHAVANVRAVRGSTATSFACPECMAISYIVVARPPDPTPFTCGQCGYELWLMLVRPGVNHEQANGLALDGIRARVTDLSVITPADFLARFTEGVPDHERNSAPAAGLRRRRAAKPQRVPGSPRTAAAVAAPPANRLLMPEPPPGEPAV